MSVQHDDCSGRKCMYKWGVILFQYGSAQIKREAKDWKIETTEGIFEAECIVNAAGVYADKFHNMVSEKKLHITPRKGEYCLLDKAAGNHVRRTIFTLPGKFGKGVLVTPTVHGNLLIGPTAADIENKEGINTTREGLEQVLKKASESVKNIPVRQVITSLPDCEHTKTEMILLSERRKRILSTVPELNHRDFPVLLR